MSFTHIMVDCETTDTDPARGGVIQLSAIKFNLQNLTVGPAFDACPRLLPTRRWSQSTRAFWHRADTKPVLDSIVAREQPARDVFQRFADYCSVDAPFGGYVFVAKPVKFDWPMIESQMIELDITWPFAHWAYLDMNSYLQGLCGAHERVDFESQVPFPEGGAKHNALHDCAWQIDVLFHAKRNHVAAELVT